MRWLRGLNLRDLTIEDRYLLVIIHALNYCEEYKERYIRYCHLKRLCDKTLRSIGMSCLSNRTYDNILEYCEEEKLIRTESLPYKKERRIYPRKKAIERRVEAKKSENLAYNGKKIVQLTERETPEEFVHVSDELTIQVTHVADIITTIQKIRKILET